MKKEKAHFDDSPQETKYRSLKEQVFSAWYEHAKTYRNLVPEYQRLLAKKKEIRETIPGCKKMTLHKVKKSTIEDLMVIPLFNIETEEEAISFIDKLNRYDLAVLMATIHIALDSYPYKTITARIQDYKYEIANCQYSSPFGIDPNFRKLLGNKNRKSNNPPEI